MTYNSSQQYESYVPVYDAVPAKWEDARPFLVEQLKSLANAANIRQIGWYLDEELISGKQFVPPTGTSGTSQQYRTIFRKVIDCSPLSAGAGNTFPHGITIDSNFTLIHVYCSLTRPSFKESRTITGNDVTIDANFINITSPQAASRAWTVVEYCLEV